MNTLALGSPSSILQTVMNIKMDGALCAKPCALHEFFFLIFLTT